MVSDCAQALSLQFEPLRLTRALYLASSHTIRDAPIPRHMHFEHTKGSHATPMELGRVGGRSFRSYSRNSSRSRSGSRSPLSFRRSSSGPSRGTSRFSTSRGFRPRSLHRVHAVESDFAGPPATEATPSAAELNALQAKAKASADSPCYNCAKLGHFSADCRAPRRERSRSRSASRRGRGNSPRRSLSGPRSRHKPRSTSTRSRASHPRSPSPGHRSHGGSSHDSKSSRYSKNHSENKSFSSRRSPYRGRARHSNSARRRSSPGNDSGWR